MSVRENVLMTDCIYLPFILNPLVTSSNHVAALMLGSIGLTCRAMIRPNRDRSATPAVAVQRTGRTIARMRHMKTTSIRWLWSLMFAKEGTVMIWNVLNDF